MTAAEKLAKITDTIDAGGTVYVRTCTRSTKVTAKDVARFAAVGLDLFRVKANSLFIAAGRRYDCIDYCHLTFER